MSTSFTITPTFSAIPTSSTYPPPPPSHSHDDKNQSDNDNDDDDDDDDHPKSKPPYRSEPSSASLTVSANLDSSTGIVPSTLLSIESTTTSDAAIATNTNPGTSIQSEHTPLNIADPAKETEAGSSGLGTAGIVLAAIFGFVALITTFYFIFRMFRRRRPCGHQHHQRPSRSNTFDSQATIEKGQGDIFTYPPSTTQETGIIFSRRSHSENRTNTEHSEPRGRGRLSFLNRRWYSTGHQATTPQAAHSEAGFTATPSSPWHRAAPFLGLGSRTPHIETSHANTTTNLPSGIQRNISNRSTGSGNARAYAHHNVAAPHRTPRTTISSISSRWLKRGSDSDRSEVSRPTNETSEMYRGEHSPPRRDTVTWHESEPDFQESSRESMGAPQLPLPAFVSGGEIRLSI